jgi:phosphate starvation-inducible PhoH-like protein
MELKPTKKHELYDVALHDRKNMPVIAYGSAGTGKTYGAVGRAVEWLDGVRKSQVILARPNVSFANTNGFLPGGEREKLLPWIRPLQQNFIAHGVGIAHQEDLEKNRRIQYYMLEHIQGLTWDNALVIVDECQNMTFDQIKVLVTRMGMYSKLVLCGDVAQTSPLFKNSGLAQFVEMVETLDLPVHTIHFTRDDVLRSEQCKMFIGAFEDWEARK